MRKTNLITIALIVFALCLLSLNCANRIGWSSGARTGKFVWVQTWQSGAREIGTTNLGESLLSAKADSVALDSSGSLWTAGGDLRKFSSDGQALSVITWEQVNLGAEVDVFDIALDDADNLYLSGVCKGSADLDPGPGKDIHSPTDGDTSQFLMKLDPAMNYLWGRTWKGMGGSGIGAYSIAVDSQGGVYATGLFTGEIDFNPGPNAEHHRPGALETDVGDASDQMDCFLLKYDSEGNYHWGRHWGAVATSVAATPDAVYVAGNFMNTVDFDPGPGKEIDEGPGSCVSAFDQAGHFKWVQTFGGRNRIPVFYDVTLDGEGNVLVAGVTDTPEEGTIPSAGSNARYLGVLDKINSDGELLWTRAWGGEESDTFAQGVCVDRDGSIYVTGMITGDLYSDTTSIDLDPGPGTDMHVIGKSDVYLSRLNSDGTFVWAGTWGGKEVDWGRAVAADNRGDVFVLGSFAGTLDFDPGPGRTVKSSPRGPSAFLVMMQDQP